MPAAINGVPMALTELIESLSIIAGQHGVGRIAAEERVEESDEAGAQLCRVYEAPAAVVLHAAHTALETSILSRELRRLKRDRAAEYAHLVWNGLWFTPMREAMDALTAREQEDMSGSVRITLFKGTLLSSEAAELDAEPDTDFDADRNDAAVPSR
ncbi:MAG: argininosuccinate synthase [Acidobacteria bacterium]|nr:argininosuccinate synthase [Acidobacteriota bacterium]